VILVVEGLQQTFLPEGTELKVQSNEDATQKDNTVALNLELKASRFVKKISLLPDFSFEPHESGANNKLGDDLDTSQQPSQKYYTGIEIYLSLGGESGSAAVERLLQLHAPTYAIVARRTVSESTVLLGTLLLECCTDPDQARRAILARLGGHGKPVLAIDILAGNSGSAAGDKQSNSQMKDDITTKTTDGKAN